MADEREEHLEGTCDHRYFPWEMFEGWRFQSPAGRIEKVVNVDEGQGRLEYAVRVFTENTGPNYSWRLPRHTKVHAIPPHLDNHPSSAPRLRIVEAGGAQGSISLVPAYRWQEVPDFSLMIAHAKFLGPGQGWELTDHPAGGRAVVTGHDTKAKARAALVAAARVHAEALKLPMQHD